MLSEAVEGEACDSSPRQTDHGKNIHLGAASDVLGHARRTFGASLGGLLEHPHYIVTHEDSQGSVARCRQRVAAEEVGAARSAMHVAEVEVGCYMVTVRLDMRHVAYVALDGL